MLVLPELFRIPFINLPIHTYGALYVLGLLTGLFVAHRQALLGKKYQDYIWDVGFWILLGALIGARILFIIVEYKYYFIDEPFTILPMLNISIPTFLALHKGGFVFFWRGYWRYFSIIFIL
jgi:prolipoprotein diacylglyceryltransferase